MLDTNVWLWSLFEPERIGIRSRAEIADRSHDVFLSAVTSWEIAIKYAAGKLVLPEPPASYVPRLMAGHGLRPLAISHPHALAVSLLPGHHRDPFDRLLIAQAKMENMILVSGDRIFEKYPVQILLAGR